MCHESSGWAMGQTIGIGKATISYDDFAKADLIIIMGQNPGTNHPRMLTALEEAKEAGGEIVAVNPLPEAGLLRYKNPQKVKGIVGRGTDLADQFLQIRIGGDMALLQAVSKRVLDAEAATPGTVLDHAFLEEHCEGLEELKAHLAALDESSRPGGHGLRTEEIDELAARYLRAEKVIITWAMGITQQKKGVATIKEIINLLLLRGNIGKPGAGASPIRGHSNVQGDRTMGIWEQMPPAFMDALGKEFGFEPPREHGMDAVETIRQMRDGGIKVFVALGGNFVGAISDTHAAVAAMENTELSVQISTKLNRSHTVTGDAGPDPAHDGPHRDRHAGIRSAVCLRRGHCLRGPRLPRHGEAGLAEPAVRGRDRQPAARRSGGRFGTGGLGGIREKLRPHPGPHLPRGQRLRGLQPEDPAGRRLCPAQRAAGFADLPAPPPARPC